MNIQDVIVQNYHHLALRSGFLYFKFFDSALVLSSELLHYAFFYRLQ